MAVVDTHSTHPSEEEYLGERQQPSIWTGDAEIVEAFYDFTAEIGKFAKVIDSKYCDRSLWCWCFALRIICSWFWTWCYMQRRSK
jgi:lipoxygenase